MSFQKSYKNHSINAPIGDRPSSFLRAIASETQDKFNHWFNHGWDSIYQRPTDESWLTAKFSLTPSQIWEKWQNPDTLIGLRFGVNTRYGLIDIDYQSKYHSDDGLRAIKGALETIGINETILIRSSFSDGLHLYYFLPELVNSFQLAQTVAIAFRENGLEIEPGQLEIFPNVKGYGREKVISFNGHRLPLQVGSYLLDDDFQPYSNSIDTFLCQADQCALSVDFPVLSELLTTAGDRYKELFKGPSSDNVVVSLKWFKHSKNAKRWKNESEKVIEIGWTGKSQSNDLLGIIAEYGRVFKGIDDESELAAYIVKTAIAAPGYFEYCRHQNEIESWARRWAKCAMLHRFPYGSRKGEFKPLGKGGPTNEEKTAFTQIKLSECVEDLGITGRLEKGVKTREKQLINNLGISKSTLWKKNYLPLWHPKYLIALETPETHLQQGIEEIAPHPDINCVVPSVVAVVAEKNLLILPTEGSDRIIDQIQSSEINSQEINKKSSFLLFEQPGATSKGFEISETLDLQAFKARKETENMSTSIMNHSEKVSFLVSPKTEALKVGDRVYQVERPSYALTITQVVNDELVKAVTNGFKGSEFFPISELRLLPDYQLLEKGA